MNLILDPDDGRETCIDQPVRKFNPALLALPHPDPWSALLNDEIRRMTDDYAMKVRARAEELFELGLALGEVAYECVPDDDGRTMRMRGTFRVVPAHQLSDLGVDSSDQPT